MIQKLLAIGVLSAALSACSQPNPLIGTWKFEPKHRAATSLLFQCKELILGKSMVSCGSRARKVMYEVRKGDVVVHDKTQSTPSTIYKVIDRNTISVNIPRMGEVQLNRSK